ncbi:hypothetical protein N2W52_002119 [Clostridium perfringens]|nr:hypothetical protein [Clostridium perfringens]
MAVKISRLKQEKIRCEIPVVIDGVSDKITVFNPTPEQRIKIQELLTEQIDKLTEDGEEIKISAEDTVKIFYRELTDLVIDEEDIFEILKSPTQELLIVSDQISEIMHEIIYESLINKKAELKGLRTMQKQGELYKEMNNALEALGIKETDIQEAVEKAKSIENTDEKIEEKLGAENA